MDSGAVMKALLERQLLKILGQEGGAGPPHPLRDHPRVPGVLRPEGPGLPAHAARVPRALRGAPGDRGEGGARRGAAASQGLVAELADPNLRAALEKGREEGDAALEELERAIDRGRQRARRSVRVASSTPEQPAPRGGAGRGGALAMSERLQKFLAGAGVASRRKAEELIAAGRVSVNGKVVTEMGTRVDPGADLVVVDGKPVEIRARARATSSSTSRPDASPRSPTPRGAPPWPSTSAGVKERVFPVGRLDWDAEGALLFTDRRRPGQPARPPALRPPAHLPGQGEGRSRRTARSTACWPGSGSRTARPRRSRPRFHERVEKNSWIRVVVGEGRRHLVKRLCESVGLDVLRLFRPEFGGVTVAGLRPGHYRDLRPEEVETLRRSAGLLEGEGQRRHAAPASPRGAPARPRRRPSRARCASRSRSGSPGRSGRRGRPGESASRRQRPTPRGPAGTGGRGRPGGRGTKR